mgnify:CR=1 FL=1
MLYILLIVIIVILELKIKNHIDKSRQIGEKKPILKGKIIVKKQYNRGMMLNLLDHRRDLVKKLSAISLGFLAGFFIFLLPRKNRGLEKLALSLCLGGGISNVLDRFTRGKVVDYFSFNLKGLRHIVFNLADIFIFLGTIIFMFVSLFTKNKPS